MKKLGIAVIVIICGYFSVAEVHARGRCNMQSGMWNMAPGAWSECIGVALSNEQTAELNILRSSFFKETAGLQTSLQQKNLEMNMLLTEPEPDRKKAEALLRELADIQEKYSVRQLDYQLKARKILTPEQIAQLPPGCSMGFGNMLCGAQGYGCGKGPMRGGRGYRCGPGGRW